jgi:hypothetical protein
MISLALKPWDVYNCRKKDVPKIDEETKIPFFVLIFGSLDILIWIRVQNGKGDFASLKIQEFLKNS